MRPGVFERNDGQIVANEIRSRRARNDGDPDARRSHHRHIRHPFHPDAIVELQADARRPLGQVGFQSQITDPDHGFVDDALELSEQLKF